MRKFLLKFFNIVEIKIIKCPFEWEDYKSKEETERNKIENSHGVGETNIDHLRTESFESGFMDPGTCMIWCKLPEFKDSNILYCVSYFLSAITEYSDKKKKKNSLEEIQITGSIWVQMGYSPSWYKRYNNKKWFQFDSEEAD